MNKLRSKAEKLRGEGYSYNMIRTELGVAKGTLSNWFKGKHFTPNKQVLERVQYGPIKSGALRHNQRVSDIETMRVRGIAELGKLTKRDLWLLGIGLYIGEGAKAHEHVRIINSEPAVIKLAIKWFKEVCGLQNKNITIALHIYPDNNEKSCLKYWKNITELPKKNFRKTQVDTRKNKSVSMKRKLPFGTAHVSIISGGDPEMGVRLHRKISGWIAGALDQK